MVGGQTGGIVLDITPGVPSEGLGYTHEEVVENIEKKFGSDNGSKKKKKKIPVEETFVEETPVETATDIFYGQTMGKPGFQKLGDFQPKPETSLETQLRVIHYKQSLSNQGFGDLSPLESKTVGWVSEKSGKTIRTKELMDYRNTGKLPSWFVKQVNRPKELKIVLSEPEYEHLVWRYYIGELTESQLNEELSFKARHSKEYMTKYATYQVDGKELTFDELKEKEPALYLEHHINLGYSPKLDIVRWKGEQWEQQGKIENIFDAGFKVLTGVTPEQALTGFSVSYLKGWADPGFWVATIKGEGSTYLYEKEYEMYKRRTQNNWVGFAVQDVVFSPPMTNIVFPYVGGQAFGHAFSYVGAAGTQLTGTATGKVLSGFASKGPWVTGATISGLVGADIGYTAATTKDGWFSTETLGKIGTYGMQFGIAYMGYRSAMKYKPVTGVKTDGDTLYFQKHVTTFRGRPILPYGEKIFVSRYGMGFQRGPTVPSYRANRFLTVKDFLANTQPFGSNIQTSQIVLYQPKGISPFYSTKFGMMPSVGKTIVPSYKSEVPGSPVNYGSSSMQYMKWLQQKGVLKITVFDYESFPILRGADAFMRTGPGYAEIGIHKDIWNLKHGTDKFLDTLTHEAIHIGHDYPEVMGKVGTLEQRVNRELGPEGAYTHEKDRMFPFEYKIPDWIRFGQKHPFTSSFKTVEVGTGEETPEGKYVVDYHKTMGLPSTRVNPMPKIYRSYETHFFVVVGYKPLFTISKTPVVMKPFEPVNKTVSDIVKPDSEISKGFNITGDDTLQILKPPTMDQVVDTEKVVETETVLDVPEELLKPVHKYRTKSDTLKDIRKFQGLRSEYDTQQSQNQRQADVLVFGSIFDYRHGFLFDVDVKTKFDQDFRYEQGFKMDQGQRSGFRTGFIFDTFFDLDYTFQTPSIRTKVKTSVIKTPTLLFDSEIDTDSEQKKYRKYPDIDLEDSPKTIRQKGFYPLVKDRVYVKGKKVYQDRFVRVSKTPLTRYDALSLAASVTNNSAAATFKLQETNEEPKPLKLNVMPWEFQKHLFTKRDDKYVEKTEHRINTQGEIDGISALGWVADRKREFKILRPRFRKQKSIDTLEMDVFDFDKQFEKIMRGVNF